MRLFTAVLVVFVFAALVSCGGSDSTTKSLAGKPTPKLVFDVKSNASKSMMRTAAGTDVSASIEGIYAQYMTAQAFMYRPGKHSRLIHTTRLSSIICRTSKTVYMREYQRTGASIHS